MFINKVLGGDEISDINATGQFIKVMSCESSVRLRVFNDAELILDTEARAGFDVQTSKPFKLIQVVSETPQRIEFWVSEHKLTYDALSKKPSKAKSFLAEYYGGGQKILPFDSSQSKVKISPSFDCVYGGEGVDFDSGFNLAAGDVYIHESAAPLYIKSRIPKEYKLIAGAASIENETSTVISTAFSGLWVNGNYAYIKIKEFQNTKVFNLETAEIYNGFINDSMCIHEGVVTALTTSSSGFELTSFTDDMSQELSKVSFFTPDFKATKIVSAKGYVFVFGEDAESGASRLLKVEDNSLIDVDLGAISGAKVVRYVHYSEESEKFFAYTGSEMLICPFDFSSVQSMVVSDGLLDCLAIETSSYISFSTASRKALIINKATSQRYEPPFTKYYQGYVKDNQSILVNDDGVYESGDLIAYSKVADIDDIFSGDKTAGFFYGEDFVFLARDRNRFSLLKIPRQADLTPKGVVKVLKESY
ncbi:hypothetical protein J5X91_17290 [Pseudoalteromonas sp. K222D]|uniref:hypothetical protein n=1 Tax=Pseudoalteromonas sp. K222D TaxID=2820756 RepID=UPI001AD682D5|nr:hypothetical protein [Pseudoalteromonas sp. K222D]MBO7927998.1 hypothetical protein [Pseudoalteromonas sp. K222D]